MATPDCFSWFSPLTAEDVIDALRGRALGDAVWLPRAMLDDAGRGTLDDRTPEWVESQLGMPMMFGENLGEIFVASQ